MDLKKFMENKRKELHRLNNAYSNTLGSAGVETIEGRAKLVDPHTVEVNGKQYTAKYICIAVGGTPHMIGLPGAPTPPSRLFPVPWDTVTLPLLQLDLTGVQQGFVVARARTARTARPAGLVRVAPMYAGVEHCINSDGILELEAVPKRLGIVGGGYIGVEFGGMFNNLGSHVEFFIRGDKILRGFDEEARRRGC